jgi:predicted dehydrogenase
VAIAEPRPKARQSTAAEHTLPGSSVFSSWQALHTHAKSQLEQTGERVADAVIVAVQDRMHCEVVCKFAELGYDILCEKPMATSVEECVKMADAVQKAGVIFGIGHGMRNTFP